MKSRSNLPLQLRVLLFSVSHEQNTEAIVNSLFFLTGFIPLTSSYLCLCDLFCTEYFSTHNLPRSANLLFFRLLSLFLTFYSWTKCCYYILIKCMLDHISNRMGVLQEKRPLIHCSWNCLAFLPSLPPCFLLRP